MIIFLLSGLWHGAGWGFVLWGALHGGAMVLQRLCRGKFALPRPVGWVLTFLFVNIAWVFFRADTMGGALALLGDLFSGGVCRPAPGLAAVLLPTAVNQVLAYFQGIIRPGGLLLSYWAPLMVFPLGMALLCLPNPVRQAQRFRPDLWRGLLAAGCLAVSVVFLSGVDTFIYANF
jgi:hypothetical protein